MTEVSELKPCPFCGGRAFLHDTNRIQGFGPAHVECGACSVSVQGEDGSSAEALAAWNRRARPSPTGEANARNPLEPPHE